jgi:elongation factor 4
MELGIIAPSGGGEKPDRRRSRGAGRQRQGAGGCASATPSPTRCGPDAETPFPGYKEVKPMVFSGILPVDAADYEDLRDALEKLRLNDSALAYEPETSAALGFGFRCGFLGLLHMEIVQERLEREYNLDLITTAPSVVYKVFPHGKGPCRIDNPAKLPAVQFIEHLEEPYLTCHIHVPHEHLGNILKLCQERRGIQKAIDYIGTSGTRVRVTYEMPLAEVVFDFFDKMKTVSRGYASLDYELAGYRQSELVKLDMLINGEPLDALNVIVHKEHAYQRGLEICQKLKEVIPKQMFEVAIQAAIGSRVIARTTVSRHAQERAGQVLRRRHFAQAQAAREAERGQTPHEAGWLGRDSAGGLSRRAEVGGLTWLTRSPRGPHWRRRSSGCSAPPSAPWLGS